MSALPNCRTPGACIAKTPDKHCAPCNLSALWADPAFREKRRAALAARMAEPEFRQRHCAASAERLAAWRASDEGRTFTNANSLANLERANTPEGLAKRKVAIRRKRLAWCPEGRWAEYIALARRMPAAEARRIIEDDIAVKRRAADAAERERIANLTPLERQLERLRNGASLVDRFVPHREYAFTLGGVSA